MAKSGATVKDIPAREYVIALAAHFKKTQKFDLPAWHDLIKTSTAKELCPQDPDWYYIRAASIARKVYLRPGTGVGAFTKVYGNKRDRGVRPGHFGKSAGGLIRRILKQLGDLKLVAKKKNRRGRYITKNGQRELDTIATQVAVTLKPSGPATFAASLTAAAPAAEE